MSLIRNSSFDRRPKSLQVKLLHKKYITRVDYKHKLEIVEKQGNLAWFMSCLELNSKLFYAGNLQWLIKLRINKLASLASEHTIYL